MLRVLMFIFFFVGTYMVALDYFRIPMLATTRTIMAVTGKDRKGMSYDAMIYLIAAKLAKRLKLSDYRQRRMAALLKSASIDRTPQMYIAYAITKAMSVLIFIVPVLFLIPILSPVVLLLALAIFFKEYNAATDIMKKKKELIEDELPRFVNTLMQELKASRDILTILETYQKHAGLAFKSELETTIADMKSGSHETALTAFESRMNSAPLSDVVRGLIAVMRGDSGAVYFQMLAHDLKQMEIQRLKLVAMKRPGKIKKYSFYMLFCLLIMYFVIIGVEIMNAYKNMM